MVSADFVASYFEAWNQHDPDGVAQHLSHGGTYFDIPAQAQLSRDDLVDYLTEYFRRDSNRYVLVGEVLSGEKTIAFQYRACPAGEEGDDLGWMGAEFITMEGEGAGLIEDYYRDPSLESRARSEQPGRARYAKSGLSRQAQRNMLEQLLGLMEKDRVFLDSVAPVTVAPVSDTACSATGYGPTSSWVSGSGVWVSCIDAGRASSATVASAPWVINWQSWKSLAETPLTSLKPWMNGLYWPRSSNGKVAGKPCWKKERWSEVPPDRKPWLIASVGT